MIKLLTYLGTFVIIVLCELGDKTQLATLIYASNHPQEKWQVFGAAALALVSCVALEVTVGLALGRFIGPALINRITGWVFLAIGLYTAANLVLQRRRRLSGAAPARASPTANASGAQVRPRPALPAEADPEP
ncbi:MAG: TMEM165/GDT1 family protein [Acetobacteraceae bacterium]|nr:TMEM165/GDT1 family protein [Acetobacteraceae bacterium]